MRRRVEEPPSDRVDLGFVAQDPEAFHKQQRLLEHLDEAKTLTRRQLALYGRRHGTRDLLLDPRNCGEFVDHKDTSQPTRLFGEKEQCVHRFGPRQETACGRKAIGGAALTRRDLLACAVRPHQCNRRSAKPQREEAAGDSASESSLVTRLGIAADQRAAAVGRS